MNGSQTAPRAAGGKLARCVPAFSATLRESGNADVVAAPGGAA